MKMNLPNKLTILRMILVPFFVFFMLVDSSVVPHGYAKWIALVLFCVASITDFLDGQIARRNNLRDQFRESLWILWQIRF